MIRRAALVLTIVAVIWALAGCMREEQSPLIELWVSGDGYPRIRVHTETWRTYNTSMHKFAATIGSSPVRIHNRVNGELKWQDERSTKALFTYTLETEKPVRVQFVGVSDRDSEIPETEARVVLNYSPGTHKLERIFFVPWTYE